MLEFQAWPKTPRLNRECTITEKIDGSNAAVGFLRDPADLEYADENVIAWMEHDGDEWAVYAQSRKKLITPKQDNAGFARWVSDNRETLIRDLGEGVHFGEWWGSGIQRGYGLPKGEKRFSLFNVNRWNDEATSRFTTPNLSAVPVLFKGPFTTGTVRYYTGQLAAGGSLAAPGFDRPEGVIVYHKAANMVFKVTVENDESPKELVA